MLKKKITDSLQISIKDKEKESINTIRLILAALKDKEIAMRTEGKSSELTNEQLFSLLKSMIKQRKESIELYKKAKRIELVKKEETEIKIIQKFLPNQLEDSKIEIICKEIISKINVNNISDMGKVMAELKKNKFAAQIDMAKASSYVKNILNNR